MSLEKGFPWGYQGWEFTGYSIAGITTSILCRTASLCFDVGQGLPFQMGARHIALSHAHMDHASGLPYLLSQKTMAGQKDTTVYLPPSLKGPTEKVIGIWQGVEEFDYPASLQALSPGDAVELGKNFTLRPFRTVHRVESQGYLLLQGKKSLSEKFQGASREEIIAAKKRGEKVEEESLAPMVAYTGDTQIEFLGIDPEVAKAKILFVEVTFWDDERPVAEARRWGHLHFDELVEALPRLQNERVVLIHTSVRYSTEYLETLLKRRLSAADRERVVLFPRPN